MADILLREQTLQKWHSWKTMLNKVVFKCTDKKGTVVNMK